MFKRNYIKFTSVVLTIWYFISIIGFDLHICGTTGERFVSSFLTGMTCEDIHPEHLSHGCPHDHSECCGCHDSHGEDSGISSSPCCSDDYKVLSITGNRTDDDKAHSFCHCGHCPYVDISSVYADKACPAVFSSWNIPECVPGTVTPADVMSAYGIWRI